MSILNLLKEKTADEKQNFLNSKSIIKQILEYENRL